MKQLRYIALIVALVAISSCGVGPSSQPGAGTTFSRAITSEPTSLDPQGAAGSGQSVILPYLFDTLVYRDADNTIMPYLAESWEVSTDGLSVTFQLRQDVKFHDGTPMDAEAVVYSFTRFKEVGSKSPLAGAIASIASVEAVGTYTVRFSFAAPSASFLGTIASPYAGIVSPTAAKAAGESFGQQPVGTGAYKLEQWEAGAAVTLVRNPDYRWGPPAVENKGTPHIERLVFKVVPDAATQLAALQAGEVDMMFVNNPGQMAVLRADSNVTLTETELNGLIYLGFNCQKPPFDDPRVRQALAHAVNKPEIIETALGGIGREAIAPLPPTLLGFSPDLKQSELGFDPERAKALLLEAGFALGADGVWAKDGQLLQAVLLTSTRPPNQAIATVLQSQLKAIGVAVEVRQLESQAVMEASSKGEFDLLLWRYDWHDPDALNIYLSSKNIGRTNRVLYSNPAVDELLEKAAHELNPAERERLYVEAQKLILADAPWQPLYTPVETYAVRTRVQDMVIGPMGRVLLNDATISGK